ncbi:hypothetical protein Pla163_19100 [Planctomycetes bacterium Pla163]|uniref:Uncharacterized protein n=1 Tax=Rohdeia mirabilis TaxID=2528008 RepID=A0A518CZZ1_9BACT|nr:hypothetical protein Pla163_19100 [Planctomycetes bacterium Pla163]
MLRTTFFLTIAALPFVAASQSQQPQLPAPPTPIGPPLSATLCPNTLDQEPLLMYDVSGYSLTGVIHQHLAVYDNGVVSISSVSGGTPLFPSANKADITYIQPTAARALLKSLVQAGARQICDEDIPVADLPLTTITVFARGNTDDRAHTFSYWLPLSNESQTVSGLIQAFIATTFPNF